MSWKLKVDEETKAPVINDDGKIVYINPDGEELPLDPPAMYEKISAMGKANQKDREKFTALRDKFSIFESIEDIVKWKEEADAAITTVANFNEKDWLKADKVDALKKEMNAAYEEKLKNKDVAHTEVLAAKDEVISKKDAQIRTLLVSNKFAVSKYFNGSDSKTLMPPDAAEALFGRYFKVEENNGHLSIKAYSNDGDPLLSKLNPGEPAGFEEAIGFIVDKYPHKDQIMRSKSGGSGGTGGTGAGGDADELSTLQAQLAEAQKNGDARTAISLKNRIFDLSRSA
jgi:hypothetical protein